MSSFISNAFMLPNDLIDKGYMALMKGPALPCYLFIVRKTRGWNKSDDSISVSQLVKGTGYNKDSVLKGCEKLVQMGVIERKSFANQPAKYVLTDSIFAVDILDSENIAGENIEGGVDILDNTLSKDSTHNNNSKTNNTKTNKDKGDQKKSGSEKTEKSTSKKQPLFDAKAIELPVNVNRDLWIQFVDMRNSIRKPLTENAVNLLIKKLVGFGDQANQSLEASIIGSYQSVYPPKQQTSVQNQQPMQRRRFGNQVDPNQMRTVGESN